MPILLAHENQKLKADPVTVRNVMKWTDGALEELHGLETTDMNIFQEGTDRIRKLADTVSSYIDWCTSICNPSRTICVFRNQNRWFNADAQSIISKRGAAFKSGDILN